MDLYTSQTHLKMAMNNGELPPVTALTDEARRLFDPSFTIGGNGMGGVVADEQQGYRCPFKGCGKWTHVLGGHIVKKHGLSLNDFKRLLGIPLSASLSSPKIMERARAAMLVRPQISTREQLEERRNMVSASRRLESRAATVRSLGYRNLKGRCDAQLAARLLGLASEIGRSPTSRETEHKFGKGFVYQLEKTFGSFNAAKAYVNLECFAGSAVHLHSNRFDLRKANPSHPVKYDRDDLLEILRGWYTVHEKLPSLYDVNGGSESPPLPTRHVFYRVFETTSWPVCMSTAAFLLGIDDPRYGPVPPD